MLSRECHLSCAKADKEAMLLQDSVRKLRALCMFSDDGPITQSIQRDIVTTWRARPALSEPGDRKSDHVIRNCRESH